jgi:folate-binding protein YgfZ
MVSAISTEAYEAARRGAALVDRTDRGRIIVSGPDRASYLQALLTNDIAALEAGRGCYSAYLTPQGRMITDLWVYELGDLILLTVGLDVKDALLSKLDQLIFSEDVQLADATGRFFAVQIVGPESASVVTSVLSRVDRARVQSLAEHGNLRGEFAGQTAIVLATADAGEPGYDVLVDRSDAARFRGLLGDCGVVELDPDAAEALRIEAGIPKFHRDMDEDTIPLEAGIESRAISFTKGCYVGQEVIVRVLHRGHGRVVRRLVGLTLDGGPAPEPRGEVFSGGHSIGLVTSSALSPALKHPIALAYLRREFTDPGTTVSVGVASAVVTALPFITPNKR